MSSTTQISYFIPTNSPDKRNSKNRLSISWLTKVDHSHMKSVFYTYSYLLEWIQLSIRTKWIWILNFSIEYKYQVFEKFIEPKRGNGPDLKRNKKKGLSVCVTGQYNNRIFDFILEVYLDRWNQPLFTSPNKQIQMLK